MGKLSESDADTDLVRHENLKQYLHKIQRAGVKTLREDVADVYREVMALRRQIESGGNTSPVEDFSSRSERSNDARWTPGRSGSDCSDLPKRGSYVYFVLCDPLNAVKIGVTTQLKQRMSALQTGCPVRLQLLGYVEGDRATESRLHQYFDRAGYYTGVGEWFFYSGDLVSYIDFLGENGHFIDPSDWLSAVYVKPPDVEPADAVKLRPILESVDRLMDQPLLPAKENPKLLAKSKEAESGFMGPALPPANNEYGLIAVGYADPLERRRGRK